MTRKDYCVIDGETVYRIITPDEARALVDLQKSKVYAIHDPETVRSYNGKLCPGDIRIEQVEIIHASSDVDLFIEEFGTYTYAIRVGNVGDILLSMDE